MNQHPLSKFASHFSKGKKDVQTIVQQVIRKELTRSVNYEKIMEYQDDLKKEMRQRKKNDVNPFNFVNVTQHVLSKSKITVNQLMSRSRKRIIVVERQLCMYILCEESKYSLKWIGQYYGGRDHSTVIHSKQAIQNMIDTDFDMKEKVELLIKEIKENL